MSRKHYIIVASALGRAIARARLGYDPYKCMCELETSLKHAFEHDNPAFDPGRFGKAINEAIGLCVIEAEGAADSSVEAALRPEGTEHEEVV